MPSIPFARRILHHGPSPSGAPVLLSNRAVTGCWFEVLRQGGCGAGEVLLSDRFNAPRDIEPGDWMSVEWSAGERWYLGRVEEIRATSPAGRRLRLEGMSIQLNEVFPGGFGESADGAKPHRYAATDLFTYDPDRSLETADATATADELVRLLMTQYVAVATNITYDPSLIQGPATPAPIVSLKFRGEESVRSIIKDLALRAQGASWGVDAFGNFFFLKSPTAVTAVYREGRDLTALTETRDREYLFNRLLLTGDYVYDRRDYSGVIARRSFRWRATFIQPESRTQYGDRRLRLWVPWIRTQEDGRAFAREFFRIYSQSTSTYLIETVPQSVLPLPWSGRIRLEDRDGNELATTQVEAMRVQFDHAPVFRMELGPADPRDLWPEPPHDERWERPDERPQNGGGVSVTTSAGGPGSPPPSGGAPTSSSLTPPSQSISGSMPGSTHSSGASTPGSSGLSTTVVASSSGPSSAAVSSQENSLATFSLTSFGSSQPLSSELYSSDSLPPNGSSGVSSSNVAGSGPVSTASQSISLSALDSTAASSAYAGSPGTSSGIGPSGGAGSSLISDPLGSYGTSGSNPASDTGSLSTGVATSAPSSGGFASITDTGSTAGPPADSSSAAGVSNSSWVS